MSGVNVTNLETRTLTRKSARAKRTEAPLVGDFGKRVGLVHELRKLARPEKFLYHCGNRFSIDEVMGHQCFDFLEGHSFLDGPLHTHETDTILVFKKFAYRPHPSVSKIIYVVDRSLGVFKLYQLAHGRKDIFLSKHPEVERHIETELQIELQAVQPRRDRSGPD